MSSSNEVVQWELGKVFNVGNRVSYEGKVYKCRQVHTAIAGWEPPMVPNLWELPPFMPSDVEGTVVSPSQVNISWSEVLRASGYDLEIDEKIIENVTSPYFHKGLEANNTHRYKVRAVNFAGESEWSKEVICTTFSNEVLYPLWQPQTWYVVGDMVIYEGKLYQCLQAHTTLEQWIPPIVPALWELKGELCPAIPLGLTATAVNQTEITVSWNEASGATGYDLEVDGVIQENITSPFVHKRLTADSTHIYRVRAKNFAGQSAWSAAVKGTTASAVIVVPPIDNTVATSVYDSTTFIYTGSNPIQTGMDPKIIDKKRVAVLRGRVLNRDGEPVVGVLVTVVDHQEFGRTLTREDGYYDMAVNGGSVMTLNYVKDGCLPIQRKLNVPWQDFAIVPDVVMISYDSKVTAIDLRSESLQAAEGSAVTDDWGTRQAVLLVSPGTKAESILPDGTKKTLEALNVRATEYTVGSSGPAAMPGELPDHVGYTYALEYSVDQAVAVGATEVQFNQPLVHYTENFLQFPVGGIVPAGYYDRNKQAWIASENGRIIKILSTNNGVADVDIDGSGKAAGTENLAALGITEEERKFLAKKYPIGQSLWRVLLKHFTPWDFNWPYGPPDDAEAPKQPVNPCKPDDTPCTGSGSIIEYQSQVLGERQKVFGSPFALCYSTRSSSGYTPNYSLDIPLTGTTIPLSLRDIELIITVAGRQFVEKFVATPNLKYNFIWDGKDAYGRKLQGIQRVQVKIGYTYPAVYQTPSSYSRSFGRLSGVPLTGSKARQDFTTWQTYMTSVECWNPTYQGLGGWKLNVHHAYDPSGETLLLGNGTRRSAQNISYIISTLASAADGLRGPQSVIAAADASLYVADTENHRIVSIAADGKMTTFAGTGIAGYSGDGGAATAAQLNWPSYLAKGPNGSIYVSDTGNDCIRCITKEGIITTIAGNGTNGYSGDGGPAIVAQLNHPVSVAVAKDGTVYITDTMNHCIRKVGPDGMIETIAGNGTPGYDGDNGPALAARLNHPDSIAVSRNGDVYFCDHSNGQMLRCIGTNGIITAPLRNRTATALDSERMQARSLYTWPSCGLYADPDGSLYISDWRNSCILRMGQDGTVTNIAGNRNAGYSGDGGPATAAQLNGPCGLDFAPDGNLYIADWRNSCIRKISSALPGVSFIDEIAVPSEDGGEIYIFDGQGRHLRTLNGLNEAVVYHFQYDGKGCLVSITDGSNNNTIIERDANEMATAIIAPGGQRTGLTISSDGFLTRVICPLGKVSQFTYDTSGLMISMTDHKNNVYRYHYDNKGRLLKDENPAGGYTALTRLEQNNGYTVTAKTALGRTSTYSVEQLPTGEVDRVNQNGAGAKIVSRKGTNGTTVINHPDGTAVQVTQMPDPRWNMQAPLDNSIITTPGGLQCTKAKAGTITYSSADSKRIKTLSYKTKINGHEYTNFYDRESNQILSTTPTGLKKVVKIDEKGNVVQEQLADLEAVHYEYDSKGRIIKISQKEQCITYAYDNKNRVSAATDAAGNTVQYEYNDADLVTKVTLANGSIYRYSYDANGNCTEITMPNKSVHKLEYTVVNQEAGYMPPTNSAYTVLYDMDGNVAQLRLPSGRKVDRQYDSAGRPLNITYDAVNVALSYKDVTSRIASVSRKVAEQMDNTIGYEYDGSLLTKMSVKGSANGQYQYRYDNNFQVIGVTLDHLPETLIVRNEDGQIKTYGPFAIERNGAAGAPSKMSDSTMSISFAYDSLGRVTNRKNQVNNQQEYNVQLSYTNTGKIKQKVETIGDASNTYEYSYDSVGQLTEVKRNNEVIEVYAYDGNGNRTSRKLGKQELEAATYDLQDRLMQQGTVSYTLDTDGFMTKRGNDSCQYSAIGELEKVQLANGKEITYHYDALGRRIGRSEGSASVQYLYGNLGNPYQVTATKDAEGHVSIYYYDGTGLLFAMERDGSRFYVAADHIGTPKVVSDSTGKVVKVLEYDSFGNLISDSNSAFYLPIGFAGGLTDPDTGLVRFGMRDYDPAIGRWTARDPILFKGGQGNLYVYCGNDPVCMVDPSGLAYDFWDAVSDIAASIGGYTRSSTVAGTISKDNMIHFYPSPITQSSKPFSAVGKLSPLVTGIKAGSDLAETWENPCKSMGQKVAKTAIIAGGVALSYLAGLGIGASFGPGAYVAGCMTTMAAAALISSGQDSLYQAYNL